MDLTALTDKVRRLKAIDGISFRNWAKHYKALPDKPEAEDRPAKIARVLLSGETIEIVDFYAGGATFQEPEDVDPYDGTVYYSINANNIDEFINHYDKPAREPTVSIVG